jgi:YidC/Oxa1 family membrane protein insertase
VGWLKGILTLLLKNFYSFTGSYGIAIILLTTLVRLILYPLTLSQTKSMAGLREIQPKMQELQAKFKDKPEEYQRKVMELYKEHNFNPFGGCLPMLLQLPIMFALFFVLKEFNFSGASFLWIKNLGGPDPTYILPILTGVTTYFQMKMTPTDPSQKAMMTIMPIFIGWISKSFPAGLALYWVVGNLLAIAQQWWINRSMAQAKERGKSK